MPKLTPEPAIEVRNLHKEFILPQSKTTSLKQAAVNIVRDNKKTTQKVLDGIDFTINRGEFFGIVGRNGSGKSTLLKMIAGVYVPTEGEIKIHGGLTPFIELGVGFNPELSGRDNVYLNGALLGYSHKEMDGMYDEIVEFAELGPFMDQKLKNYSSGMQVRLAFSIAIKAKNDILIFDEVLAVGDEAFQRKCMEVFHSYRRNKQTVILVTHSMDNVHTLCTRALMLADGKVEVIGNVKEVAAAYTKSNATELDNITEVKTERKIKHDINLVSDIEDAYHVGDWIRMDLEWKPDNEVSKVSVAILDEEGRYLIGTNSGNMKLHNNRVEFELELNLGMGQYYMSMSTHNKKGDILSYREKIAKFSIYDDHDSTVGGVVRTKFKYK